jgi:hypothetical protein
LWIFGFYRGTEKSLARPTSLSIAFFQSREQVIVRRGQIHRIGRVIKTLEAQTGQFLLGCKCPVSHFLPGRAKDLSGPLWVRAFKIKRATSTLCFSGLCETTDTTVTVCRRFTSQQRNMSLVKICNLFLSKYPTYFCQNIQPIFVKICNLFLSKHATYFCQNIQPIFVKTCNLFLSKYPTYFCHNIQSIFVKISNLFLSQYATYFSFSKTFKPSGTHPASSSGFFSGLRQPQHEAVHSYLSNSEDNNEYSYIFSPIQLHGCNFSYFSTYLCNRYVIKSL